MIKTLLEYIHNKIPSIKEFEFEDKSIDVIDEDKERLRE